MERSQPICDARANFSSSCSVAPVRILSVPTSGADLQPPKHLPDKLEDWEISPSFREMLASTTEEAYLAWLDDFLEKKGWLLQVRCRRIPRSV